MNARTKVVPFIFLSAVLAVLPACSGKGSDKKEDGQSVSKEDLQQVAVALLNSANDNKKAAAATTFEELKRYGSEKDPDLQAALSKVSSGEIVVVWGYSLPAIHKAPGGPAAHIIVHDKNASTKGGYVVTGDLKAKKVTAEEFKELKLAPTK